MIRVPTPQQELLESLEKHNATFTKLLSLIPARFYLPPDQDELDSRWMKNKKRRTGEEIKQHKRKAKAEKVGLTSGRVADTVQVSSAPSSESPLLTSLVARPRQQPDDGRAARSTGRERSRTIPVQYISIRATTRTTDQPLAAHSVDHGSSGKIARQARAVQARQGGARDEGRAGSGETAKTG